MRARRELVDAATRRQIVAELGKGNYRHAACRAYGIDRSQLEEWENRAADGEQPYAAFVEELDKAEAAYECQLVAALSDKALVDGDTKAAQWLLERRRPTGWSGAVRKEISETIGLFLSKLQARLSKDAYDVVLRAAAETEGDPGSGDTATRTRTETSE